jgi:mannose-6-phosphate isomerase-like protein (cupin superfamily)
MAAAVVLIISAGTVVAQNNSVEERRPSKPIRHFVVTPAQSLADVEKKLQSANKVEELIGGEGMEVRVAIQHEKGTTAPNAELHDASDDVYYVLEGSATLTLGGALDSAREIEPGEWRAPRIVDGQKVEIKKGDLIICAARYATSSQYRGSGFYDDLNQGV